MSQKQIRNVPASIRSKLLQLSKQRGEDFNYLLIRYGSERLLYRLSQSPYQRQFILKGATLFTVWNGEPHRATKDLDLLSFGANDVPSLMEIFKEICCQQYEQDGISFQEGTVTAISASILISTFLIIRTAPCDRTLPLDSILYAFAEDRGNIRTLRSPENLLIPA